MGQVLVRSLDDRLIQSLRVRAARHGRSVEAERRAILDAALGPLGESFTERAACMRARTPRSEINSTDLIGWDRDHNYDYDPDEL